MPTIRYPSQDIGTNLPFTGNGTATSYDYVPHGTWLALSVVATQDGTREIFEVQRDGAARSLGTAVAMSANDGAGDDAEIADVDMPARVLRMVYTNTDNTAGTVSFNVVEK